MPKIADKFEDWTPPWTEDDFDADKAARRIYNLLRDKEKLQESNQTLTGEKDALQTKVEEFETKDLSEVDRLKRENEALRSKAPETKPVDDLRAERLEIALEKGLTATQARRLTGSTREELEADADAYIEEHGLAASNENGEGKKPPSRQPRGKLTTGLGDGDLPDEETDPAKLGDQLPPRRF